MFLFWSEECCPRGLYLLTKIEAMGSIWIFIVLFRNYLAYNSRSYMVYDDVLSTFRIYIDTRHGWELQKDRKIEANPNEWQGKVLVFFRCF